MFNMSIYTYRVFDEVARQGSFIRAADQLHVTPSAVSHTIANLEEEMGFPLFIRDRKGVKITAEGKIMMQHIRDLIRCDDLLQQEAAGIMGLSKGNIIVGGFSSVTLEWIPDIVDSFHSKYPGITVKVLQGGYRDVTKWLYEGSVDIAFATETITLPEDVSRQTLFVEPMLCIVPEGTFNRQKKSVALSEIANMSFILPEQGNEGEVPAIFCKYDFRPAYEYLIESDDSIIALVAKGLGISILPQLAVNNTNNRISKLMLDPPEYRAIQLAVPHSEYMTPAARAFYNEVTDFTGKKERENAAG